MNIRITIVAIICVLVLSAAVFLAKGAVHNHAMLSLLPYGSVHGHALLSLLHPFGANHSH